MDKAIFTLSAEKKIRNNKHKPGTVIFIGECAKGFNIDDVNKAVQLGQITVNKLSEEKKEDRK